MPDKSIDKVNFFQFNFFLVLREQSLGEDI